MRRLHALLSRHRSGTAGPCLRSEGFTIVELMIATVVSSTVLLVITIGVVYFTNGYYKGINNSSTQTVTQNAIDAVAHAVEFNASGTVATDGSQGIFCAGNQVFLYTLGKQLTAAPSATNWGLYQLDNPSVNCVRPADASGGTELLGTNMRLSAITLAKVGNTNVWRVSLKVAYGDSDLLCRTSIGGMTKGSCAQGAASYASSDIVSGTDVSCKSQTGSQFCSIAGLDTAIGQRIIN